MIKPKPPSWFKSKRVDLDAETIARYNQATNPSRPFWRRVKSFLLAESRAGRIAKIVKDFFLIFIPYGRVIQSTSELVTVIMKEKKKVKKPHTSRTLIIFGLLFAAALAQKLGVDMGLELTPDAEWVAMAASAVGIILRLITGKPIQLKNP